MGGISKTELWVLPSSSDEEEETAPAIIPRELHAVRRRATLALAVTGAMCIVSAGIFLQTQFAALPTGLVYSPAAMVGLSEPETPSSMTSSVKGSVQGLLSELEEAQYGTLSTPFRLVAQSVLRADGVADGRVVQELPAGVQVFPLVHKGDWVQVVVPARQTIVASVKASFGWLPVSQGGGRLLQADTQLRAMPRPGSERTQEQVEAKWDEVRTKNAKLKTKLAELEVWMQNSNVDRARVERQRSIQAARAGVTEVINFQELSKSVGSLQKELKRPSHLLGKVGGLFGR